MRIAYGQSPEDKAFLCDWLNQRVGAMAQRPLLPDGAAFIGVVSDSNEIAAVVAYNEYYPEYGTIQVHIAAATPLWCRGNVIRDALAYPFQALNVYKVWGATPSDLDHVLRVNAKMGFTREAVLRHHYGRGRHAWITSLLKPHYLKKYWNDAPTQARTAA